MISEASHVFVECVLVLRADSPPQRPWNALVWTVRSPCMNGMFLAWKFFAGAPRHPDCTRNAPCGDCSVSVSTQFGIGVRLKHAFFPQYRQTPIRRSLCSLMSLEKIFYVPKTTFYSLVLFLHSHSNRIQLSVLCLSSKYCNVHSQLFTGLTNAFYNQTHKF